MKINLKSDKAFLRWVSKGDEHYQALVQYALESLLPIIEDAGFTWVEKSPDGYKTPHFMIDLERGKNDHIENVTFNFEKNKRYKFKIHSKISENSPPYKRVIVGNLVRYQSELDKAKWWGASWKNINKAKAFKKEVDKVSKLLPQILDFLSEGKVGPNIWSFR